MTVGPFDLRKRRLRCVQCSASHLKCSGKLPCENCIRRGKNCAPPTPDWTIRVNPRQPQGTSACDNKMLICPLARPLALDKQTLYAVQFFNEFLARNNFTGRPRPSCSSIYGIFGKHQSFSNVVSAIGALQTSRSRTAESRLCTRDALDSYRAAVTALRAEIVCAGQHGILGLSWCTLFLGLFELMYDNTGEGWLRHMLYGTSRLLQLLSPDGCCQGSRREFFLEARIFEIARSMLFSERSFLSTAPWISVAEKVWWGAYAKGWTPMDSLLDVMTLVADLCIRTTEFMKSKKNDSFSETDVEKLQSFAGEGALLRSEMTAWSLMAREWQIRYHVEGHNYIALVYYSALSIYHSGIYDYSFAWSQNAVITPALDQQEIQQHVRAILDLTMQALRHTNLSGVVFLVPLRIAGARATSMEQRSRISTMLVDITNTFRAAKAVLSDLEELWDSAAAFRR